MHVLDERAGPIPDVSVIIPVYNCEPFLRETLESVLAQDGVSIEVIAISDGSTDGSLDILQSYAGQDARLRVLTHVNSGLAATRNAGLAVARGEWIAFLDGDDWMAPGTLCKWVSAGRQSGTEVVIGNAFSFQTRPDPSAGTPMLTRQPWGQARTGPQWFIEAVEYFEWFVCVWVQLLRRDFISRHALRFDDGMVHEDILWTLRVSLAAQGITFVSDPAYGYRRNPGSITNSPTDEALARRAFSYLHILRTVSEAMRTAASPTLRRALGRQLNREGGNFLHLVRKRIRRGDQRAKLAESFISSGYARAMLKGATNASETWRALRCWVLMRKYARRRAGAADAAPI